MKKSFLIFLFFAVTLTAFVGCNKFQPQRENRESFQFYVDWPPNDQTTSVIKNALFKVTAQRGYKQYHLLIEITTIDMVDGGTENDLTFSGNQLMLGDEYVFSSTTMEEVIFSQTLKPGDVLSISAKGGGTVVRVQPGHWEYIPF